MKKDVSYVLVAFTPAESEGFGIIAYEGDALAGVSGATAEVARLDPVCSDCVSDISKFEGRRVHASKELSKGSDLIVSDCQPERPARSQ